MKVDFAADTLLIYAVHVIITTGDYAYNQGLTERLDPGRRARMGIGFPRLGRARGIMMASNVGAALGPNTGDIKDVRAQGLRNHEPRHEPHVCHGEQRSNFITRGNTVLVGERQALRR